jgi:hypothetical protein
MVFCNKTRPADARHKRLDNEEKDGQAQMVRQYTFTLPRHVLPKLNTTYFTGTANWIRDMQRRSSIEGIFGNLKSRSGGAMDKGWIGVGGQVQHALLGTIKMVALNYQNSQAWMRNQGGQTADPVYAPAPMFHGLDEMTAERAEEIRRRVSNRAASSKAAYKKNSEGLHTEPGVQPFTISKNRISFETAPTDQSEAQKPLK